MYRTQSLENPHPISITRGFLKYQLLCINSEQKGLKNDALYFWTVYFIEFL